MKAAPGVQERTEPADFDEALCPVPGEPVETGASASVRCPAEAAPVEMAASAEESCLVEAALDAAAWTAAPSRVAAEPDAKEASASGNCRAEGASVASEESIVESYHAVAGPVAKEATASANCRAEVALAATEATGLAHRRVVAAFGEEAPTVSGRYLVEEEPSLWSLPLATAGLPGLPKARLPRQSKAYGSSLNPPGATVGAQFIHRLQ